MEARPDMICSFAYAADRTGNRIEITEGETAKRKFPITPLVARR